MSRQERAKTYSNNKTARGVALAKSMSAKDSEHTELLDSIFRDPTARHGLRFFTADERAKIQLRLSEDNKTEIYCLKRRRWFRAKPEEVVRQTFLVWVQDTLKYPLERVLLEWPIQMGEDSEKERSDIVVFTDDACTDPYIVFELKRPESRDGLEQLRSYLRWTGCFFGCWSNGSEYSFQLKEEDRDTKKGPYRFRDIARLPKLGQDLDDILQPLTFAELKPISDMRSLIQRLEHDALANAGVNAFDELFKLFFAKLHDEFRPKRKDTDAVDFRLPTGAPDIIYRRFNELFQAAKKRPHWNQIFDDGDVLKLKGDALRLAGQPRLATDGDIPVIDSKAVRPQGVRPSPTEQATRAFYNASTSSKGRVRRGDVLLNSTGRGTLGRAACYQLNGPAICDNHVSILRPDPTICNPVYLALFLNSDAGLIQSEQLQTGSSGQLEIYPEHIQQIQVYLPREKNGAVDKAWQDRLAAKVQAATAAQSSINSKLRDAVRLVEGELR